MRRTETRITMDRESEPLTLSEDDRRVIGLWASDCAERVLPLFESVAPDDTRPREAIEAIRAYARGGKRTAGIRSACWAAYASARDCGDSAASASARAAGLAAASAYMHAQATLNQARHALGPAAYAARARELAGGGDPALGDEEIRWAIERASDTVREIVRRFPVRGPGRGRMDALYFRLDAGFRVAR